MNITTVHAVHFSPTGTVEKTVCRIARNLAKSLGVAYQEFSYAVPANREKELSFTDHDLVVWGSPTYAGRVPNLLLPYLTGKVKGNGALAVPVVLFGNRNFDDSLMELHHILRDDGFTCIAAGAFVGEHAFSTTLGAGRPDAADEKEMDIFSSLIAEKLLSEDYCETIPAGNDPIAPYFTPRDRHGNPEPRIQLHRLVRRRGYGKRGYGIYLYHNPQRPRIRGEMGGKERNGSLRIHLDRRHLRYHGTEGR